MKFHSGFSLKNESYFFDSLIHQSEYTVSGFSYGAIKAFEEVIRRTDSGQRVDTLQLFSPAFFQTKTQNFKRLQTLSFVKSKQKYMEQFIKACFTPYEQSDVQKVEATIEELEDLLLYEWNLQKLHKLENKGVKIEVYLGSEDAVIDVEEARKFFLQVATVTYIKSANHFLQTKTRRNIDRS